MKLVPGQVLRCYVSSKLVWHYGIYSGGANVIDMAPRRGIAERHIDDFSEGARIEIVEPSKSDLSPELTLLRAKQLIGTKKYDIINLNCEQFVNFCRRGKKTSSQLNIAFLLFCAICVIIFQMQKGKGKFKLGF